MSEERPAWQQRVIEELKDLHVKVEKLGRFILESFDQLPVSEQERISRQYLIMRLYEQVLRERVEAFA